MWGLMGCGLASNSFQAEVSFPQSRGGVGGGAELGGGGKLGGKGGVVEGEGDGKGGEGSGG